MISPTGIRVYSHAEETWQANSYRTHRQDHNTYQLLEKKAPYSRRVGMDEVKKNDFKLNISCYVSAAGDEEEIDLAALHGELVALDQEIKMATQQHNEYLKELGLPLLP